MRKITGAADQVNKLIRLYKNERLPSIAITVDLLTTGIDVPAICHLVFMRRVRSRILYEQMIGRATRRCGAIGKTVFRIYDPVDLYAALQAVNTMQPLVKDPGARRHGAVSMAVEMKAHRPSVPPLRLVVAPPRRATLAQGRQSPPGAVSPRRRAASSAPMSATSRC